MLLVSNEICNRQIIVTFFMQFINRIKMIFKPRFFENELKSRVRLQTIHLHNTVKELEQKIIHLEYIATHDNLTKLYNRQKFNEVISKEFKRHQRYSRNLSVMMLDIDHFKNVNDSCGHVFGDMVLKKIAKILQSSIRDADTLCRWGGEEFMILLPETSIKSTEKIAEKIRRRVEEAKLFCNDKPVTISIGSTLVSQNDTVDTMIVRVDKLLYMAKEAGRNCVIVADMV